MEQCKSITGELAVQVNTLKDKFCAIIEQFKDDHNIEKVTTSLSSLGENTKKFMTDSKEMKEDLHSLEKTLKEFENGTRSIVDVLTDYCDYKQTLDDLDGLLKKRSTGGHDSQLDLELMGCDWARYLESMHCDINS